MLGKLQVRVNSFHGHRALIMGANGTQTLYVWLQEGPGYGVVAVLYPSGSPLIISSLLLWLTFTGASSRASRV